MSDLDPRGAPAQGGLAPIVIEKHRVSLDGEERTSFYACGVTRSSREEAMADAWQLDNNAALRAFVAELLNGEGPLGIISVAVGVVPPYSEAPSHKCKGCGEYGHTPEAVEHRDWCYRERAHKALEGCTT